MLFLLSFLLTAFAAAVAIRSGRSPMFLVGPVVITVLYLMDRFQKWLFRSSTLAGNRENMLRTISGGFSVEHHRVDSALYRIRWSEKYGGGVVALVVAILFLLGALF